MASKLKIALVQLYSKVSLHSRLSALAFFARVPPTTPVAAASPLLFTALGSGEASVSFAKADFGSELLSTV